MKQVIIFLAMLAVICLSQFTCLAAVIHVPADQPTIQAGIDAAVDGDTVLVADGTYTGDGNRDIDFMGKAITVTSENGAETCVINCEGSETSNYRGFCFHLNENSESVLNGFTIKKGFKYNFGSPNEDRGGAIYISGSSPSIKSCIFTDNRAASGGAIFCSNSSAVFLKCDIFVNRSPSGAGFYIQDSALDIIQCVIHHNSAALAESYGGGIGCYSSDLYIENTLIYRNYATGSLCYAGGIGSMNSTLVIMNSILVNNSACSNGDGIYAYASNIVFSNSIIWGNPLVDAGSSIIEINFSDVEDGWIGLGNLDKNPEFINNSADDFHLSPTSPCIDGGEDQAMPKTDYDDNPRLQGGAVDMGAYEYHGWPSIPRVYVKMPSHVILPGDRVKCLATVWNPYDEALSDHRLFVVLEAFGQLFMAPSFSEFDSYPWSFGPGRTVVFVLPEFEWPDNVGSASNIVWYACLTNMEMTALASPIGVFDFGWSD